MTGRRIRDWQQDAACRDIGYAIFTTDDGTSGAGARSQYREARLICAGCPVKPICLEFALTAEGPAGIDERDGVYGGLSPHERYAIYHQRQHATAA